MFKNREQDARTTDKRLIEIGFTNFDELSIALHSCQEPVVKDEDAIALAQTTLQQALIKKF
ncbi:hypothetical protein NIES593_10445 [Hydrococcus rivularis NIES-593]|uniref:Uncharacterized protein n=1 Tax=Hydrococcus rivularis NIES-593 TaxID=1921803 RepID=A0A1U7HI70_9CYAN|nr:hypothetical protein [Hydrococcus rivularis]OKH23251.1 hypothetical protein NIES593_10445 [Hydrococcus rivularis NIES-593]